MRLLFTSLALLALCKLSSGEQLSWGYVDMFYFENRMNESTFSIPDEKHTENYHKIVLGNLTGLRYDYLAKVLGNTLYAMIWHRLGLYETLPKYYKSALDNGVLCEVPVTQRDGTIISIQYQAEELTDAQRATENEAAKQMGFDCKSPSNDQRKFCACLRYNVLLYCAAVNLKIKILKAGVAKKTCANDISDALMTDPTESQNEIFSNYFTDDIEKFDRLFNNRDPGLEYQSRGLDQRPIGYCMTIEPESHATVRAIFAANALHWTLDGAAMQTVFKGTHKDLDSACAVDNFKTSQVGKCACTKDTGIAFCVQKARAEYYKKIGYLNCTVEAKFEGSNKPDIIPPFTCFSDSVAAGTSAECAQYRKAMN